MQSSPFMLLYCPAPHDVHLALPFESDDQPASQSAHKVEAWVSLTLPIAHLWHCNMPVVLPNSPGKHGRQDAALVES